MSTILLLDERQSDYCWKKLIGGGILGNIAMVTYQHDEEYNIKNKRHSAHQKCDRSPFVNIIT
jgi:hypothetical protein